MNKSDRLFFSKFAIDSEYESIFESNDFGNLDLDQDTDQFQEETEYEDSNEYFWDED